MIPLMPNFPHSSTKSRTVGAGVAITAKSAFSGKSDIEANAFTP